MRSLGLLGGSYNPVHAGHLALAQAARASLCLDEVWLIPCAQSADGKALAPGRSRLAWLKKALKGLDGLKAWDGELRRGGVSRSIDTLRQLRRELGPALELTLLLGADQVRQLSTWKESARLQTYARLAAFRRPGVPARAPRGFRVRWLEAPLLDVSSTALRAALAAGKRPAALPRALRDDAALARFFGPAAA